MQYGFTGVIFLLYLGHPPEESVISNHRVSCWFECSEKCLDSDDCVTFSHRTTSSNDINCKIASEMGEIVEYSLHDINTWITYERQEIQPVSITVYSNLTVRYSQDIPKQAETPWPRPVEKVE